MIVGYGRPGAGDAPPEESAWPEEGCLGDNTNGGKCIKDVTWPVPEGAKTIPELARKEQQVVRAHKPERQGALARVAKRMAGLAALSTIGLAWQVPAALATGPGAVVTTAIHMGPGNSPDAITCSSTRCLIIGTDLNGHPLVAKLDVASGTVHILTDATSSTNNFEAITCATPSACLAGGRSPTAAIAQIVNGTTGALGGTNSIPAAQGINALACFSATSCWAGARVGNYPNFTSYFAPLSNTGVPGKGSQGPKGQADSIACVGSTCLAAVLNSNNGDLVVLRDGKIAAEHTATRLLFIGCPGTTLCYGVAGVGSTDLVPINSSTGVPGTPVPLPSLKQLVGIACPSTNECVILAFTRIGQNGANMSGVMTLSNGKPSPVRTLVAAGTAFMSGLACSSATRCWAIGSGTAGGIVVPVSP
jgi:hypothetical protein